MESFQIQFESPAEVFLLGQQVSGRVLIKLKEQFKARSVTLCVVGKARTCWSKSESRQEYDSTTKSYRTVTHSVPYSAEVIYLDLHFNLCQPNDKTLSPGIHDFPFTFTLPAHCPPSFEGTIGYIRYYCDARIDRPWKFDKKVRKTFTVMPHFDLNTMPYAAMPMEKHIKSTIGMLWFKRGKINAKVTLDKSGYVPGESVVVSVDVNNETSRNVTHIETSLIETATYHASRTCNRIVYGQGKCLGCLETSRRSRNVAKFKEEFIVEGRSFRTYQKLISIPPIVPSFNICPIIQVEYQLKIQIVTKGIIRNTATDSLPVLIGTIPVQSKGPFKNEKVPFRDYLEPPTPSAPEPDTPPGSMPTFPIGQPPSYAESVFGCGTLKDEENTEENAGEKLENEYTPRYIFYPKLGIMN